jgi:hypothetical protein
MAEFIAYYRVSTDRQGASGLGLAAQREAVARFLGAGYLSRNVTALSPHGRSIGSSPKRGAPRACRGCIPCFLGDPGGYNFMGFSAAAIFTILAAAKPPIGVPVMRRNYSKLLI